jgi:hypothetical protein
MGLFHLAGRRLNIRMRGRPMVLRRQATPVSPTIAVFGYARAYNPGELSAGIQQGDVRVEILNEEIVATSWPAPPRNPDRLTFDGRTYTIMGAFPLHDGTTVAGWSLWIRGA